MRQQSSRETTSSHQHPHQNEPIIPYGAPHHRLVEPEHSDDFLPGDEDRTRPAKREARDEELAELKAKLAGLQDQIDKLGR